MLLAWQEMEAQVLAGKEMPTKLDYDGISIEPVIEL